jgi:hypothetical protein
MSAITADCQPNQPVARLLLHDGTHAGVCTTATRIVIYVFKPVSEWREPDEFFEPLTGDPFSELRIGQYRLACVLD